MSDKLLVFLKAPERGKVKTRLARSIGEADALGAYELILKTLLERLSSLRDVEIWFDPPGADSLVRPLLRPGWDLFPQSGSDLGCRLSGALENCFARGASRVLVIGSDCPYLNENDITLAWQSLNENDLVLGPALDGGYWLIGMKRLHQELFMGIPWSSGTVLEETLKRATNCGLSVLTLRELSDVDTVEDWRRFQRSAVL